MDELEFKVKLFDYMKNLENTTYDQGNELWKNAEGRHLTPQEGQAVFPYNDFPSNGKINQWISKPSFQQKLMLSPDKNEVIDEELFQDSESKRMKMLIEKLKSEENLG